MKVIHAVWEKRNLGIDCHEIIVEPNDTSISICSVVQECSSPYIVVKIPTENYYIMKTLQTIGFTFVECIFNLEKQIPEKISDIKITNVHYDTMNSQDINQLFIEIRKGMFSTDRISQDPFFTHEQSANRYIGWINDELARGCILLKLVCCGQNIGFCGLRESSKTIYTQFLTGLYPAYHGKKLGASIVDCAIHYIAKNLGKKFITTVSSNNKSSLNVHLKRGCLPTDWYYVYIYHAS